MDKIMTASANQNWQLLSDECRGMEMFFPS
jgi:hypothetical protein